jgi:TRAP transporter TAXI family solute receptor
VEELISVLASPLAAVARFHTHGFLPALLALAVVACASDRAPPASRDEAAPPAAPQKAANTIYIGTAGVTGVYYPAGGAICRLVNRSRAQRGITCSVESTEGSIANIEALRASELDMAIVQSDWQFHAYQGDGPFAQSGPYRDLRAVLSLHAEPLTIVAREDSGIATVADLRGKRVNIGNPGSGQRATTEEVMAANGWTMADFAQVSELPSDAQAAALAGGRVDAIVFTVGHPSNEIYAATKATQARLVPISGPAVDRLLAEHPYYAKAVIPGGLYFGNDAATPSFGVRATLVTTAEMPDDLVYLLVKSVFENFDQLQALHPALAHLDRREMARAALTAPLHPGAERYYREAGLI